MGIDSTDEESPFRLGKLVLLCTNVCSIRNKWAETVLLFEEKNADIIALSETWLTMDDHIPQSINNSFEVHRVDRGTLAQGGGTALLVRKELPHIRLDLGVCTHNIQMCAINLLSRHNKVTVVSVYRSPGANQDEDNQLIDVLDELTKCAHKLMILGDFNLPGIKWDTESCSQNTPEERFLDWIHSRGLFQHISENTRFRLGQSPSLLDLVLSKYQRDVNKLSYFPPIGKSDHIVIKLVLSNKQAQAPIRKSRNFAKMDITRLQTRALELNWLEANEHVNVDDIWQIIKRNLQQLQEEFAPLKTSRGCGVPPWWRASLGRVIKRRNGCWKHYREVGTQLSWIKYTKQRNLAVALIRSAKRKYELKLALKVKDQPKRYYSYAQSKRNYRGSVGTLIIDGNHIAPDDKSKASVLSQYFSSVHRIDNGALVPCSPNVLPADIMNIDVTEEEVIKVLSSLDTNKAPGPDGIHPAIIKPLARIIANPVCKLFTVSLEEGTLPSDWKTAVVVALHKGGSTSDRSNYRPVSLTSIIGKCMEKIIRTHICGHLVQHSMLNSAQHGFLKNRSCLTNLLCYLEEVTEKIDEGKIVEVCYLDFSKAFDSVNHRLLLYKIGNFGIVGKIHQWLTQFLTGRTFTVKVGEETSSLVQLTSGVPQGSVLGPLLFLLFINDLTESIVSPSFIFADDVKVVGANGRADLERDIEKIVAWSQKWDLPLNAGKSQLLSKARNSLLAVGDWGQFEVSTVDKTKDLGVIVTADFSWSAQCEAAAHRARRELFKLKSVLSCKKSDVFMPFYKAIVRPHLEYCVQAWAPLYKKDALCLEKVQRLATRIIEGQRGKDYSQRLSDLNLFSLERRRVRGDLIEVFKIKKGLLGISAGDFFTEAPHRVTRGHEYKLMKQHCRLNIRANFFSNRIVNRWNKLPEELINLSNVQAFKKALDKRWSEIFPQMEH